MKKNFISKTFGFIIISLLILSLAILIPMKTLQLKGEFRLNENPSIIVIGNSRPECAFNDSLLKDLINLSSSGESYFYSYIKLKKVLEDNQQVKTVFIEFSNGNIEGRMDDWIWGEEKMKIFYPIYSPFMSFNDNLLLVSSSKDDFMPTLSISAKKNLARLLLLQFNYSKTIGGFKSLENIRDSTINIINISEKKTKNNNNQPLSFINLNYLRRMIDLCKQKNVQVILFRSPIHPLNNYLEFEDLFFAIKSKKFADTEFLDLSNFPLHNSEFADLTHLNKKGAQKFSIWFNKILHSGILKEGNKEEKISVEIARLRQM